MARQPRMEYPGAIHHVKNRGDRREGIFLDDVDRQDFRQFGVWGSQEFRDKMLAWVDGKAGDNVGGALHLEQAEAKAARIIAEELNRLGWTAADLTARRKSAPRKLAIVARLRKEW